MTRQIIDSSSRTRSEYLQVMVAGGVLGALAGVGAAYVLLQARDRRRRLTGEETPVITTNAAVKLGLLVFGLLRQVGDLMLPGTDSARSA